jgi:hypothetical protein
VSTHSYPFVPPMLQAVKALGQNWSKSWRLRRARACALAEGGRGIVLAWRRVASIARQLHLPQELTTGLRPSPQAWSGSLVQSHPAVMHFFAQAPVFELQ